MNVTSVPVSSLATSDAPPTLPAVFTQPQVGTSSTAAAGVSQPQQPQQPQPQQQTDASPAVKAMVPQQVGQVIDISA